MSNAHASARTRTTRQANMAGNLGMRRNRPSRDRFERLPERLRQCLRLVRRWNVAAAHQFRIGKIDHLRSEYWVMAREEYEHVTGNQPVRAFFDTLEPHHLVGSQQRPRDVIDLPGHGTGAVERAA